MKTQLINRAVLCAVLYAAPVFATNPFADYVTRARKDLKQYLSKPNVQHTLAGISLLSLNLPIIAFVVHTSEGICGKRFVCDAFVLAPMVLTGVAASVYCCEKGRATAIALYEKL